MYSVTQVSIPLSTPAHVETAHAKLKNHFTRITRLNRSKIVSEPSASKTGTSDMRSWRIVAITMQLTSIYKHNNVCISSLKGDKLTREGLKSTWNYVFVLSGYSTRKMLDETWFYPLGIDCTGKCDQNDGYVQIRFLDDVIQKLRSFQRRSMLQ